MQQGLKLNVSLTLKNWGIKTLGSSHEVVVFLHIYDKNITVDTFFPEEKITLTPSGGSVMKTIAGTEGLYQEVNGRYIFLYSDNDQFVQVDAPEEKLIEEVISK